MAYKKGTIRPPKIFNSSGYYLIYKPDHPSANKDGRILEHRYVMEQFIKRFLKRNEIVHHKNEIKIDNRLENLQLLSGHSEHSKIGHSITGWFPKGITPWNKSKNFIKCLGCEKKFHSPPSRNKRLKTCSHRCKWIYLKQSRYKYPKCKCGKPNYVKGMCRKCYNRNRYKNL